MVNTLLKVLILLCVCSYVLGQEPSIKWGGLANREMEDEHSMQLIGADSSGIYLLVKSITNPSATSHLVVFDANFNKKGSTRAFVPPERGASTRGLNKAFFINGEVVLFAAAWNKGQKQSYCGIKKVDAVNVGLEKEFVEMDRIKGEKYINHGYFTACLSADQSKFFVFTEHQFDKKANKIIKINLFETTSWKKIATKDITLPYIGKRSQRYDIHVDNDGNCYALVNRKIDKGQFEQLLFHFDPNDNSWTKHILDLKGKYWNVQRVLIDSTQKVILCGLLKANRKAVHYEGVLRMVFDPSQGRLVSNSMDEFGEEFDQKWAGNILEIGKRDWDRLSNSFKLLDVFLRADGNLLYVMEFQDITKSSNAQSTDIAIQDYVFKNNELLVFCTDKEGKIAWSQVIYKKQEFKNTGKGYNLWGGTNYAFYNQELHFLYNNQNMYTHNTSSFIGADGKPHKAKEFSVYSNYGSFYNCVDQFGAIKYKGDSGMPLFSMHKNNAHSMSMRGNVCYQQGNGLIIISEMEMGTKYKVGQIQF